MLNVYKKNVKSYHIASMKTVAFRLEDDIVAQIRSDYPNLGFAAKRLIQSLPYLRRAVLDTLKGIFTILELKFMLAMRKGVVYEPRYSASPGSIVYEVIEADKWEDLTKRWGIEAKILYDKIFGLTPGQVYFLTDWLDIFWKKHDDENSQDEYVKRLIIP